MRGDYVAWKRSLLLLLEYNPNCMQDLLLPQTQGPWRNNGLSRTSQHLTGRRGLVARRTLD
jgi:hypothetical protein